MRTRVCTMAEQPDLADHGIADTDVWPEYNLHGDVARRLWPRLSEDLPQFQLGIYEHDTGSLLAEGHTVPCWWDGTDAGLPAGVDAVLESAFSLLDTGGAVNALCAVAAEVPHHSRGRGLARVVIEAMSDLARRAGLRHLIAPVRPSTKDRYPITPIERYRHWRRADGRLFDPWMRVHEACGASIGNRMSG